MKGCNDLHKIITELEWAASSECDGSNFWLPYYRNLSWLRFSIVQWIVLDSFHSKSFYTSMRFTDANWNSKLDEQIFLFESFYSVSGRPACFDYKSMDSNLLRILHPKWICFHLRFYWDWWNRNERIICGSLQVDAVVSLLLQISGRSLPEPRSGDWKSVNNSESFRERNVQRICKRRNVNLELRFCRAIEPAPSTVIRISFYTPTVSRIPTWPDSWNRFEIEFREKLAQ